MKKYLFFVIVTIFALHYNALAQNQTVANGESTVPIIFPTGCTYHWVNNKPEIGLGASGDGYIDSFTAINTGDIPITATITGTVGPSNPPNYNFITNSLSNSVSAIAPVGLGPGYVYQTILVGENPGPVTVSDNGYFAYVANSGSGTVSVIDVNSTVLPFPFSVIATITTGKGATGIAENHDETRLYVACADDKTIAVINTATNTVIHNILLNDMPQGVIVSHDNSKLYVALTGSNTIRVINTTTYATIANIPVGQGPMGVILSPDGKTLFAADRSGSITAINTTTNQTSLQVKISSGITGIAINRAGSFLYVSNYNEGTVSVIDPNTLAIVINIPVGEKPYGLSLDYAYQELMVANSGSNTVSVIRTTSQFLYTEINIVSRTIVVGSAPLGFGLFVSPNSSVPCSGMPVTFTVTVNPPPKISTTAVIGNITANTGKVSASPNIQHFAVTGNRLITEIVAVAPTGFEISLSPESGYTNNLIIPEAGGVVSSTIIYVRSSATALVGNISGNVILTSKGAITKTVTVSGIINIAIPNTFTPNGDEINDVWEIATLQTYKNCLVEVFNRYGKQVYKSIGYDKPWDGTMNGKELPYGTYYYTIDLKNGNKPLSGYIVIIK